MLPLYPKGRLLGMHPAKDKNMETALLSFSNYQAPYWLTLGREEIILCLHPFGKLIHFTKVT